MTGISTSEALQAHIMVLEARCFSKKEQLKDTTSQLLENLQPAHLIKNSLHHLAESPALRSGILQTVAGIGIGMLTNRFAFIKSKARLQLATAFAPAVFSFAKRVLVQFKDRKKTG